MVVNQSLDGLFTHYEKSGFVVKTSKTIRATTKADVLGVTVDLEKKTVKPAMKNLYFLLKSLTRVVESKVKWRAKRFESLIGKIVWVLLVCRPMLSVLSASYAFIQSLKRRGPLYMWQGVKEEMEVILGLLPLIQSPLRGRHEGAIASDATGTDRQGWVGLGVTYTKEFPRTEFVA
jgi:hypothetical protein